MLLNGVLQGSESHTSRPNCFMRPVCSSTLWIGRLSMFFVLPPYALFETEKVDTRKSEGADQEYRREKEEGIEEEGERDRKRNMKRER